MKTIKTLPPGSKIYVNGYNAKFLCVVDDYTIGVSYGGDNSEHAEIEECELRLTHQIFNEVEKAYLFTKKTIKSAKLFCKENKELVKGILFGVLFMSLAFVGFKFLM